MSERRSFTTPADHGGVFVFPPPETWGEVTVRNHDHLQDWGGQIGGKTLGHWRSALRRRIGVSEETPILVTGHQAELIHPGVWAKQVLGRRASEVLGFEFRHLVVDSDLVKGADLIIPHVGEGGLEAKNVHLAGLGTGRVASRTPGISVEQVRRTREGVRLVMGEAYEASSMPEFLGGLEASSGTGSWAVQCSRALGAVDDEFEVSVPAMMVSAWWGGPILADLLVDAGRFATAYNESLEGYRRVHRVRQFGRPMPELEQRGRVTEVAAWVVDPNGVRYRLYVESDEEVLRLAVQGKVLATLSRGELREIDRVDWLPDLPEGWSVCPRALTLTLWARLLLADLFVHGIGGARYDEITDDLMLRFYGMEPPTYACVSATWRMAFMGMGFRDAGLHQIGRTLRDMTFNPQRYLTSAGPWDALVLRREEAVDRGRRLAATHRSAREERRTAFEDIRWANQALCRFISDQREAQRERWEGARARDRSNRVGAGREYFIGLFPREAMRTFLHELPDRRRFASSTGG